MDKRSLKYAQNGPIWRVFDTELPDRSVLKGQKWVENAKIQKFKCDILGDFHTLWHSV